MTVEKLIELLKKQDPKAKVLRGDTSMFGDIMEVEVDRVEQITHADGVSKIVIR